jgi:osmoprotectant transport system substrate-binding protein
MGSLTPAAALRRLATALAVVLALTACQEDSAAVVIGVGSTTEQQVLAALAMVALDDAGLAPELRGDLGGTVGLRREALRGSIDVFWDYTGAAWALGLGNQAPPADPTESYERVRRADEENDLVWLDPSEANATLALFVDPEVLPPETEPRGMGWLAGVLSGGGGALCADEDFIRRPGGLDALADAYAIDLGGRLELEPADEEEAVAGVVEGRCLAGLATATSAAAYAADLVPVADDLLVFPAFVVTPVVRGATLAAEPRIAEALAPVVSRLDSRTLAQMNAAVEGGADPQEVAGELLAPPPGIEDG